jgi:hypothetical protein
MTEVDEPTYLEQSRRDIAGGKVAAARSSKAVRLTLTRGMRAISLRLA